MGAARNGNTTFDLPSAIYPPAGEDLEFAFGTLAVWRLTAMHTHPHVFLIFFLFARRAFNSVRQSLQAREETFSSQYRFSRRCTVAHISFFVVSTPFRCGAQEMPLRHGRFPALRTFFLLGLVLFVGRS